MCIRDRYTYDAVNDVYNKSGSHTISELTTQSDNYFKPNGQISLNYKNTFGKHDVGVLALWEFYNDRTDWVKAYRQFTIGAIDPVSYTHLDVYKRQSFAKTSIFSAQPPVWQPFPVPRWTRLL